MFCSLSVLILRYWKHTLAKRTLERSVTGGCTHVLLWKNEGKKRFNSCCFWCDTTGVDWGPLTWNHSIVRNAYRVCFLVTYWEDQGLDQKYLVILNFLLEKGIKKKKNFATSFCLRWCYIWMGYSCYIVVSFCEEWHWIQLPHPRWLSGFKA